METMIEKQPTTVVPFYQETGKEVEIFKQTYLNKIPLLLKGPTGTGKSRFIEHMAAQLNKQLITVSCHEETSATDLIGRFIIKGAETVWMDGPLVTALKTGAILYLDEIAEARPDVLVAIHSLTDHRRALYIDKLDIELHAPENFMLVASYNPGYQRGFKDLKPSTKQRFVAMQFSYPKPNVEAEIICNESNIDKSTAEKLVKLGNKIRNLVDSGLAEPASTRLLVDAAKLIVSGIPSRLACEVGIVHPLTDDIDIINALNDLVSMSI